MSVRDFTDFDSKIDQILPDISDSDKDAVRQRIGVELDRYDSNPDGYKEFVQTRERIRAIERKALRKLGKEVVEPKAQGRRCSLCSSYESDTLLIIWISDSHSVCSDCVVIVKEILGETAKD